MAYDADQDQGLVGLSASELFEPSITSIGFRKGAFYAGLYVWLYSEVSAAFN